MEVAAHKEKIVRLDDLRGRLDPVEDFELWMWASMTAATNALNACLHQLGLTEPGPYFPHQIPGLYVAPEPGSPGRWKTLFAAPGDVIHIGLPPFEGEIPGRIQEAARALDRIEQFREPYVRGHQPITPDLGDRCGAAYRTCMSILEGILAEPPAEPQGGSH
jgi:hypothetical protein